MWPNVSSYDGPSLPYSYRFVGTVPQCPPAAHQQDFSALPTPVVLTPRRGLSQLAHPERLLLCQPFRSLDGAREGGWTNEVKRIPSLIWHRSIVDTRRAATAGALWARPLPFVMATVHDYLARFPARRYKSLPVWGRFAAAS